MMFFFQCGLNKNELNVVELHVKKCLWSNVFRKFFCKFSEVFHKYFICLAQAKIMEISSLFFENGWLFVFSYHCHYVTKNPSVIVGVFS